MTPRVLGLIALVVGMVLLIMGHNASDSVANQLRETFTGYPLDRTAWYIIGGVALAITGLLLTLRGLGYGHHDHHGRLA